MNKRRIVAISLIVAAAFSFVFAASKGFTDWSAFERLGETVGGYFSGAAEASESI